MKSIQQNEQPGKHSTSQQAASSDSPSDDSLIDRRNPGFYIIDDEIVDDYGALIGPLGLAVYNVLVKHADKHGESSFPSYQTIAKKLGISRNSAMKGVETLLEQRLIGKTARMKNGAPTSNAYSIMPVQKHSRHSRSVAEPQGLTRPPSPESALPPSPKSAPLPVQNLHQGSADSAPEPDTPNQTQFNQTHTHPVRAEKTTAPAAEEKACGVCGLVISLDLLRRYGRNQSSPLGEGWVGKAFDECFRHAQVREWLERQSAPAERPPALLNPKDCPDCAGTGFWEPGGRGKGVAKCPHDGLYAQLTEAAQAGTHATMSV